MTHRRHHLVVLAVGLCALTPMVQFVIPFVMQRERRSLLTLLPPIVLFVLTCILSNFCFGSHFEASSSFGTCTAHFATQQTFGILLMAEQESLVDSPYALYVASIVSYAFLTIFSFVFVVDEIKRFFQRRRKAPSIPMGVSVIQS